MPAKEKKVLRFKPKSTVVEAEYILKEYARHLKVSNITSIKLPIFIKIIEKNIPIGAQLNVEEYSADKENYRFIPDKELLDLREELEDMQKKKEKK